MTNTNSMTTRELLLRFSAFKSLLPEHLDWLSDETEFFHCDVGHSLLLPDRKPEYCYALVGVKVVLHHDPTLRRPVTLAYSVPGDLIGWSGLVRRAPCEWVTAATPVTLGSHSQFSTNWRRFPKSLEIGWIQTIHLQN